MSMIKCPECRKEISDTADKCPNCGFQIKKKNPVWLIIIAVTCGLIAVFVLLSAAKDLMTSKKLSDNSATIKSSVKSENKDEDIKSMKFDTATNEELASLPDSDDLVKAVGSGSKLSKILSDIGVTGINEDVVIGNYHKNEDICIIDIKCATSDSKILLINFMYVGNKMYDNSEWSVTSIADYNSGKYYYIEGNLASAYDIYDYETGELVSKATTTPDQIENDAKEILGVD